MEAVSPVRPTLTAAEIIARGEAIINDATLVEMVDIYGLKVPVLKKNPARDRSVDIEFARAERFKKRAAAALRAAQINQHPEKDKVLSEVELEKRARLYVPGMLRILYDIALDEKTDADVRVKAADVVLQRALGRPTLRSVVVKRKDTVPRVGDRPPISLRAIVNARQEAEAAVKVKSA
mgnify:FL=1